MNIKQIQKYKHIKTNTDIYSQLKIRLKEFGAECSIVSANHIAELESDYNLSLKELLIDKQFIKNNIRDHIDFSLLKKNPSIRTLIIIATPSPQLEVKFNIGDSPTWLKIPPIYSDKIKINKNIINTTIQLFDKNGYKTFPIVLPKKLLAVRSGMAKYGKNNICYVPNMGSYHRLTAFASDLPSNFDSWQEIQKLERCNNCKACQLNCPTSAICDGQFVVKAERCLTYFNEESNPFPKWIDNEAHNCLIGCMKCQSICPENKKHISILKCKEEFSNVETNMILERIAFEKLPEKLQLKISNLCLKNDYDHLSRNIKALN